MKTLSAFAFLASLLAGSSAWAHESHMSWRHGYDGWRGGHDHWGDGRYDHRRYARWDRRWRWRYYEQELAELQLLAPAQPEASQDPDGGSDIQSEIAELKRKLAAREKL
jgi:hypothetical protein